MAEERVQGAGIFGRFFQPRTDGFLFPLQAGLCSPAWAARCTESLPAVGLSRWGESERDGRTVRYCRLGRACRRRPHRARHSDPTGSGSHGCNDDCRLLWSTRRPQPCMALAASVSQSSRRGQCVRGARWRGYDPRFPLRRHYRCAWKPQVGYRAAPVQRGTPVRNRLPSPHATEAIAQG